MNAYQYITGDIKNEEYNIPTWNVHWNRLQRTVVFTDYHPTRKRRCAIVFALDQSQ